MTSSTPLPDDQWVSAWQSAAAQGHPALDAAHRMLSRGWLMSVEDLALPADATAPSDYVEVVLVALFWSGLPGASVDHCLISTHPYLCLHRPDVQIVSLEDFGGGASAPLQLGVFQVSGHMLARLVEFVSTDATTTPLVNMSGPELAVPTAADVFNVIDLPVNFAGGVCAHLGGDDGGLLMQVEGMALNDEPYHSGDEVGNADVGSWQRALLGVTRVPPRQPRGPAAAKRTAAAERRVTVKTAAVPLHGLGAPPAKALGAFLGGGDGSARTRRSPRAKEPPPEMLEIRNLLQHLVSRVDTLETSLPPLMGGGAPGLAAPPAAPSLLAPGRVAPPPGCASSPIASGAPMMTSPSSYQSALESARALLPPAGAPGRVAAPVGAVNVGQEPDTRGRGRASDQLVQVALQGGDPAHLGSALNLAMVEAIERLQKIGLHSTDDD
eukprot:6463097-Amphidinium_carterae.1